VRVLGFGLDGGDDWQGLGRLGWIFTFDGALEPFGLDEGSVQHRFR
jgi:hypothetical protein